MPFGLGSSRTSSDARNVDNAAKTLLANIRFMSVDNPIRTIVVTSAVPNEGKTFVAASLARAMATSGRRTLLVECDMRRRSMANELQLHAEKGVYAVLAGEVSLSEAVVSANTLRLHFLDAEPHIPNPSDLLGSRRFANFIESAKKEYDYIVFDTPPVGTFVDAAVLGSQVDATFMVVRERHTRRDEIARAAEQLKTANVRLTGVIMNFCERQSSEYYYEYYYTEGNKRKRRRRSSGSQKHSSGPKLSTQARSNGGDAASSRAVADMYEPAVSQTPAASRAGANSWSNAPDESLLNPTNNAAAPQTSPSPDETVTIEYAKENAAGDSRSHMRQIPMIGNTGILPRVRDNNVQAGVSSNRRE